MHLEPRDPLWVSCKALLGIVLLGMVSLAAACTRSTMVVALPSPPARPSATAVPTPTPEPQIPTLSGQLAVAWVGRGELLQLRGEAGIASEPQENLPFNARDLRDLGRATLLGSSEWIQVESASGMQGWVPSWNLIEQIAPIDFCRDPRVHELLDQARDALLNQDGEQLGRLVSQRRGLVLRHDPWNPELRIQAESVPDLFKDQTDLDFGERYISETAISGTFSDVFLPKIEDVLSDPGTSTTCLVVRQGSTQFEVGWPQEYANVPYYGFHRPAPMDGNPFDWRTLAVGIEYVEGSPNLAVLLLLQPPI